MLKLRTNPLTLEQFLRLPEFKPALEFIGGRMIQKMSPKLPHSVIQSELLLALTLYARPRGLGKAYTELRAVFGGSAQVPDVSFYCRDRLPKFDERERGKDVTVAPDLAVEIRSPGQGLRELRLKLIHSVKHGSKYGWLIDEKRRQVHVFGPGQKSQVMVIGQVLTLEEILPGYELPLAEMFGWLA